MQGVYTTSVSKDTIDEAPVAYKFLNDIMGDIQASVDVIEVMKPIYNFKAFGWPELVLLLRQNCPKCLFELSKLNDKLRLILCRCESCRECD